MKILIIEDETIAAKDLADCIKNIRISYEIVFIAKSVKEAIHFLHQSTTVDLIFSDIQLGDGTSFEIFSQINAKIPVIFCTAYDNFAIDAFAANGFDYVLKPFTAEKIKAAIEKFEHFTSLATNIIPIHNNLNETLQKEEKQKVLLLTLRDKIIPISVDNIALSMLSEGLVIVQTFDGKKISTNKYLEEIEKLNPHNFFRANRQFLVHRDAIVDVQRIENRKLKLNLNIIFSEDILISKEKATQFLRWYAQNA
jgi:DNA-binding LytR/AlgR family response regulator